MILLGCSDGTILTYDVEQLSFVGGKVRVADGQIGSISIKNNRVVIGTSAGRLLMYSVQGNRFEPPSDPNKVVTLQVEAAITALAMDDLNSEGILGTSNGNIHYVNLQEQQQIRLVSRVSTGLDRVSSVSFDPSNPHLILTSCGASSSDVKVFTTSTLDQVIQFQINNQSPVRFICGPSGKQARKHRIVGHANGELTFVGLDALKVEFSYKIDLLQGEELSAGAFSPSGLNFAVGTSLGNAYFGQFKKDIQTKNVIVRVAKLHGLSTSQ